MKPRNQAQIGRPPEWDMEDFEKNVIPINHILDQMARDNLGKTDRKAVKDALDKLNEQIT